MNSDNHYFDFPAIFSVNEKYNKNIVQQLHEPFFSKEVSLSNLQVGNKKYVVIKDEEDNKYLLTNKRKGLNTTDYDKVLFGKFDDILDIQTNTSIKYEWLKHPKLIGLTDSVIVDKANEAYGTWKNVFNFKLEDIEKKIEGLRNPQFGAIHSALAYWSRSTGLATIVMPTGTGKTEVMLSLLANGCCKKLFITVPTDALREQIFNKFLTYGKLKSIGALEEKAILPVVGVIYRSFTDAESAKSFFEKCNVVITTMPLAKNFNSAVQDEIVKAFTHLFIDEAHHSEAKSWHTFRSSFPNCILQFTATPFREDGKRIDGDIIYSYPLRKAQEEGYFRKINFVPILEYDPDLSDEAIAQAAVKQLRLDIKNGYTDHMLMARVSSHVRANQIYEIYKQFTEFNPVLIHTGIQKQRRENIRQQIINRRTKIIVCVDMLGEGFDLPELKIAAFHDVRRSLPITLQLAGRFTRSKEESKIGDATFIANRADLDLDEKLSDLYSYDSDWNYLLEQKSENLIKEEIDYKEFLSRFTGFKKLNVSLQNLFPAMSTVIFKNNSDTCNFRNYRKGLIGLKDDDFVTDVRNDDDKTLVIITGQKSAIEWGQIKDIYDTLWNLYIIHYDENQKLLFIHCSDTSSLYYELAKAIIGDSAQIINGVNVFRALNGINRLKLQNVGLKEIIGKLIRYTSRNGTDIAEALTDAEKRKATKAVIFGVGFEGGAKSSMGCSYKGRIWSKQKSNLKSLVHWFVDVGRKVLDETIDPNEILKNTFTPIAIAARPDYMPIGIDWNEFLYERAESKFIFEIDGERAPLYLLDIELTNPEENGNIAFAIKSETKSVELELTLFEDDGVKNYTIFKKDPNQNVYVYYGKNTVNVEKFLYENPPTVWFVNGSSLSGNSYIDIQNIFPPFDKNNIITRDWTGVDISSESQGVKPKITNSIQYHLIDELKQKDYDIVYDDDSKGEIADIITIKKMTDYFQADLYHLKFAKDARIGTDIENLYQVCGQAQKSINWKFKEGYELFEHLLRRNPKRKKGNECSRIEKGTEHMIEKFKAMAKERFIVKWKIIIVQPGITKSNMTNAQLELLGVTESYLKQQAEIPLTVIGSD